jgi:hypothetical protein
MESFETSQSPADNWLYLRPDNDRNRKEITEIPDNLTDFNQFIIENNQ